MWLQKLDIRNVRNLVDVSLEPSPRLNIIAGHNGSGKTSLLESIYLISSGKSFRTHRFVNIPNRNEDGPMGVYTQLRSPPVRTIPLGLEYRDRKNTIKVEGKRLNKASELANYLPVVVIHQESQRVFTQSPKYRRAFLDWGVFHVEHNFIACWKRFSRSLKQRNAALSQRSGVVSHWDGELQRVATAIDSYRHRYLDRFVKLFDRYAKELLATEGEIRVDYRRGWGENMTYQEALAASLTRDRQIGFTQKGPHRADIIFRINGTPLHEYVSRGQQKLLVYSLYIAQAALYSHLTGKNSIFLVDDLTAELDSRHVTRMLKLLYDLETQTFITTPDLSLIDALEYPKTKTFHVEHGQVTEVL